MTNHQPIPDSRAADSARPPRKPRNTRGISILHFAAVALLFSPACSGQEPAVGGDDPTFIPSSDRRAPTISLDPGTLHQTISGWYATSQAGQDECSTFDQYKTELFDRTINELGLNRMKLAVRSYEEHPRDHYADFMAGRSVREEWKDSWFHAQNDNADPFVIDPAGFQWSDLDHKIDNMALPMRQRLQARGEALFIMLTFTDASTSEFDHKNAPEEYAEFILALYQHMQSKYGFVPDVVEVVNEPDTRRVDWTYAQLGAAVAAAGRRLEAAGFVPRFAVPAAANMSNAVALYDQILLSPGASNYITELSYHRYGGVSGDVLSSIGHRAERDAIGSSMSEHIASGYEALHDDLKIGRANSWMQFALALCGRASADGGAVYYNVIESDSAATEIRPQSRTPFLWQYFRYIRSGARRIEASSTNGRLDPLAFINTNDRYVVVIKAERSASFTIGGLPKGLYGVTHATPGAPDVTRADVDLPEGAKLSASIPDAGVITIFGK